MNSDEVLGWIFISVVVSIICTALYVVPKHDEDGWEVKNSTCIRVLKDALDQSYAKCNTDMECNVICAEQRNK